MSAALEGPLLDAQGRLMTYLRLSVTDRCNFRCTYCSPASWGGTRDLLTAPELVRVASLFMQLGIRRVRLTGGEPLLRPDLVTLVQGLSALPGLQRIALTTNASRLAALAAPLRQAGLAELNISLDTLNDATFRRISPQGSLASVLEGIDAALAQGFSSVKLNVVVVAGVNDGEVPALVAYAHARGVTPRFIELMPFGAGRPVPTRAVMGQLAAAGICLEPASDAAAGLPAGPARYFRAPSGLVGFISPNTENFCGGCNRVRVASNGDLRSCLGGRAQVPLGPLMRAGATDEVLAGAVRRALGDKPEGHRFEAGDPRSTLLPMMGIGG